MGILHSFNSILQNNICSPSKPKRGRINAYTMLNKMTNRYKIIPARKSVLFPTEYIIKLPNAYGAINNKSMGIFFMSIHPYKFFFAFWFILSYSSAFINAW